MLQTFKEVRLTITLPYQIHKNDVFDLKKSAQKTLREIYTAGPNGARYWRVTPYDTQDIGEDMRLNCLPVHLAIVDQVKQRIAHCKQTRVVIGLLEPADKDAKTLNTLSKRIRKALSNNDNVKNLYHTWIELDFGNNTFDVFDITGPYWKHIPNADQGCYFDRQTASQFDLKYTPIFKSQTKVLAFHERITYLQSSNDVAGKSHAQRYLKQFYSHQPRVETPPSYIDRLKEFFRSFMERIT
ncbi:hypothetical protein [Agarivorans sp. Z349TD_8]|uniref:hypothetical protein n=1 Tax=Agarivorans sp. Z349TD_8 TaxID=3421434 RepID=UPI003D7DDA3E